MFWNDFDAHLSLKQNEDIGLHREWVFIACLEMFTVIQDEDLNNERFEDRSAVTRWFRQCSDLSAISPLCQTDLIGRELVMEGAVTSRRQHWFAGLTESSLTEAFKLNWAPMFVSWVWPHSVTLETFYCGSKSLKRAANESVQSLGHLHDDLVCVCMQRILTLFTVLMDVNSHPLSLSSQSKGKKPLFVQLVLDNIWSMYDAVVTRR